MRKRGNRKRWLPLFLTVLLVVGLLPQTAAAEGPQEIPSAAVSFTAQAEGGFLCAPQQNVAVRADLAETYGYTDKVTDGVSALDVLVRAHELVFGEAFTAEDAGTYLQVSAEGWVSAMFGDTTGACGYYLNREMPSLMINEQEVTDGDALEFFLYRDTESWGDRYAVFWHSGSPVSALTAAPGQALPLSLQSVSWDGSTAPVAGAQLMVVDAESGALSPVSGALTDASGSVSVSFDAAGTYLLSAVEAESETPLVLPLLSVAVRDTISVTLSVFGDTAHGENGEEHTYADGNLMPWIEAQTYTVPAGATVKDLLETAFSEHGITCENPSGTWIESVTKDGVTLGSGTNGPLCGWLFFLNGAYGTLGIADQYLADGDAVVFHYTDNYNREYGTDDGGAGDGGTPGSGAASEQAAAIAQAAGAYLTAQVTNPAIASIGGDWTVFGLARAGFAVPEGYYETYYHNVAEALAAGGGVLSASRYTEYARVILALTAAGYDVTDVAGYNLLAPLADYERVVRQGESGAAFALLALDSRGFAVPAVQSDAVQTTREALVSYLLSARLADGGWALAGETADADITALVLTALAPYVQTDAAVQAAVDGALGMLSAMQGSSGAFASMGEENSESCAQVVVALTALGINPDEDTRFIKNGVSVLDALCSFALPEGGFCHLAGGGRNMMATEQGYLALAAWFRFQAGQAALYDLRDVRIGSAPELPQVPPTGDAARPEIWLSLCAAAFAVLVCGVRRKSVK